jgi:hypothetical protein
MVITAGRRPPLWAWCVGLALVASAVSGALFAQATDGHPSELLHMERLVAQAPSNAETFRWAVILDMLGYYLLLAPLFVTVGRRLYHLGEQAAGWWTIGALMYVTAGSVAAMALAYGVPPILEGYGQASGSGRQGLVLALTALVEAAVRGVWQTLDPIVVGAWAVATGLALRRLGRRALGTVGIVLGTSAALFCVLRATGVQSEVVLYAVAVVLGVAIWVYVLGLTAWLWRQEGSGHESSE